VFYIGEAMRANAQANANAQPETSMESAVYQVSAFWDADAAVWVATSEDVLGLATEADTIEALSQKLRMIPDLLLSNHVISADYADAIAMQLTSHRQELIEVAS
jgi:Domain of unknown function (DUF1902)